MFHVCCLAVREDIKNGWVDASGRLLNEVAEPLKPGTAAFKQALLKVARERFDNLPELKALALDESTFAKLMAELAKDFKSQPKADRAWIRGTLFWSTLHCIRWCVLQITTYATTSTIISVHVSIVRRLRVAVVY